MTKADDIGLAEAPYGSELYAQCLQLREAILRKPLGLTLSEEELADDFGRRHFCAVINGTVVASVSFKPLGPHTLQLKQMAVADGQQGEGIGSRLLAYAEAWARRHSYGMIILNARIGAEEFYKRHGYAAEGEPFDENTIPHIRMTKRTLGRKHISLEVGDKAPGFSLPADGGGKVSLKELKGKKVVLYFYPKDDTAGCMAEACAFRDSLPDLSKVKGAIVGVSRDSVASHDKFKTKFNLTFPLASDESGRVCEAYGTWVEKSMYGKKYMGIERSTFLIDERGVIRAMWRKVKVPGHAEEVLKAAEAL
jgi:thioredoxin-dependent peroxiredoxin